MQIACELLIGTLASLIDDIWKMNIGMRIRIRMEGLMFLKSSVCRGGIGTLTNWIFDTT